MVRAAGAWRPRGVTGKAQMGRLTDNQVDDIARQVLQRMVGGVTSGGGDAGPMTPSGTRAVQRGGALPAGVFRSIDDCVAAAAESFKTFGRLGLSKRKAIIASVRASMAEQCESLSREAWEETGLGRIEDKIRKNRLVTVKTPGPEDLEPTAWTGDDGLTLVEPAPYGVIAAITPTTNPTSTIICNAIGMLSAGNTVVFNVHPNAKGVSCRNVGLINEAVMRAGGPPNVVTAMAEPTIAPAQTLMRHPGIRLLVVTGGPGVVKEAMSSGKRAICAGPGNPPVVVDKTAIIDRAAQHIVAGASLDNNIICVDEKEVFVVESVADQLLKALGQNNCVILTQPQVRALE